MPRTKNAWPDFYSQPHLEQHWPTIASSLASLTPIAFVCSRTNRKFAITWKDGKAQRWVKEKRKWSSILGAFELECKDIKSIVFSRCSVLGCAKFVVLFVPVRGGQWQAVRIGLRTKELHKRVVAELKDRVTFALPMGNDVHFRTRRGAFMLRSHDWSISRANQRARNKRKTPPPSTTATETVSRKRQSTKPNSSPQQPSPTTKSNSSPLQPSTWEFVTADYKDKPEPSWKFVSADHKDKPVSPPTSASTQQSTPPQPSRKRKTTTPPPNTQPASLTTHRRKRRSSPQSVQPPNPPTQSSIDLPLDCAVLIAGFIESPTERLRLFKTCKSLWNVRSECTLPNDPLFISWGIRMKCAKCGNTDVKSGFDSGFVQYCRPCATKVQARRFGMDDRSHDPFGGCTGGLSDILRHDLIPTTRAIKCPELAPHVAVRLTQSLCLCMSFLSARPKLWEVFPRVAECSRYYLCRGSSFHIWSPSRVCDKIVVWMLINVLEDTFRDAKQFTNSILEHFELPHNDRRDVQDLVKLPDCDMNVQRARLIAETLGSAFLYPDEFSTCVSDLMDRASCFLFGVDLIDVAIGMVALELELRGQSTAALRHFVGDVNMPPPRVMKLLRQVNDVPDGAIPRAIML